MPVDPLALFALPDRHLQLERVDDLARPANASPRCGAETAITTDGSESGTVPIRCSTATAQRPWALAAAVAISSIFACAISA